MAINLQEAFANYELFLIVSLLTDIVVHFHPFLKKIMVNKIALVFSLRSFFSVQSTTSNWNTYRPKKSVPVRGSVPVRDNPYNFAYKATLHIKIALFCGQIRW